MKPIQFVTSDWSLMIDQLVEAGMTLREIGVSMGISGGITNRIFWHYKRGTEPLAWRADALRKTWCERLGKTLDELPTKVVESHHRVQKRKERVVHVITVPQWPPVAQPSVQPIKRKGRPPKVKEVA